MKQNKGIWLVLSAAAMWGTAGIFVKELAKLQIGNMETVFLRAFFTVLILAVVMLLKDRSLFRVKFRDIWLFAATGIFSIVMFNFCYYKTMSISSLSVAAVLLYTAPFFVVIISALFFKEKLTVKKCLACITAFIGCCMVSGLFKGGHNINAECIFFGLLTGFGYALYTVFGNMLLKRGYDSMTITFYAFLFSMLGSAVLIEPVKVSVCAATDYRIMLVAIGMALTNTVIPYILYTNGLKTVDAGKAPIIATLEPVVATVIGIAYKEYPDLIGVLGILLVLSSVIILNLKTGRFE